MPRPPIDRTVAAVPRITLFKPAGVPARNLEQLQLGVDELEAIRLVDLEGLSHAQAAAAMDVSRQTVGRVLERGRARVAEALVGGKAILIGGGQYRVEPQRMQCLACQAVWTVADAEPPATCPECESTDIAAAWRGADGPCGGGRRRGQGGGRGGGPGAGRGGGGKHRGRGQGCGHGHET